MQQLKHYQLKKFEYSQKKKGSWWAEKNFDKKIKNRTSKTTLCTDPNDWKIQSHGQRNEQTYRSQSLNWVQKLQSLLNHRGLKELYKIQVEKRLFFLKCPNQSRSGKFVRSQNLQMASRSIQEQIWNRRGSVSKIHWERLWSQWKLRNFYSKLEQ